MSIMSKYVVSSTRVNRLSNTNRKSVDAGTTSVESVQSQAESRWWRWQWLNQKRTANKIRVSSTANVLG